MEHGPNCGDELEIIAVILKWPVIEKIDQATPAPPIRQEIVHLNDLSSEAANEIVLC